MGRGLQLQLPQREEQDPQAQQVHEEHFWREMESLCNPWFYPALRSIAAAQAPPSPLSQGLFLCDSRLGFQLSARPALFPSGTEPLEDKGVGGNFFYSLCFLIAPLRPPAPFHPHSIPMAKDNKC